MLTESTDILINQFHYKILKSFNYMWHKWNILIYYDNELFFDSPLIFNYFKTLVNNAIKLFIEKQNGKEDLIKNNLDNIDDEKIYDLKREKKKIIFIIYIENKYLNIYINLYICELYIYFIRKIMNDVEKVVYIYFFFIFLILWNEI